jgi:hypothetical protein
MDSLAKVPEDLTMSKVMIDKSIGSGKKAVFPVRSSTSLASYFSPVSLLQF